MFRLFRKLIFSGWLILGLFVRADTFTLCTYNLENYCLRNQENRPAKKDDSRHAAQKALLSIRADVVALEEVCDLDALNDLRNAMAAAGLDYPHWEFVNGPDAFIHVAILSRFPMVGRRSHTNELFLLNGRRRAVSRGFAEVDIQVRANYTFTLLAAHLKSKRTAASADEAEIRAEEALLLRDLIDQKLKASPDANLAVVGDFNDTKDSLPIRTLLGRGTRALIDTRPVERVLQDRVSNEKRDRTALREVTWTDYYAKEDLYSRIDYIMVSKGMAREWDAAHSYVHVDADWGVASDHRPVVAVFYAGER